jgi:FkbM family methyltransferase
MRHLIKKYRKYMPDPVWKAIVYIGHRWFNPYSQDSYAQTGENIILDWYFGDKQTGFYVDVGAHHPKRYSNTYRLYRRGWRGLNIDANPGSMRIFRRLRPRDINVEAAVNSVSQELTFYIFKEPELNTFDKNIALEHADEGRSIIKKVAIKTVPLVKLLDQHVPHNTRIDLLSIDAEGLDYEVLKSNDWDRYLPEYILIECLGISTLDDVGSNKVTLFLSEHHYSSVSKTAHTVLYRLMHPETCYKPEP